MALSVHQWAFAFGVLGNIISFIVFLSPLPTFYQMYKKKSTEGYQSIPYVVALFSAMLWIYYAFVKAHDTTLLITINTFGIFIETLYVAFFLFFSTKKTRVQTAKALGLFVAGGFGAIIFVCQFLIKSAPVRFQIVGWICLVFSLCVFVAPLCIVRQVIRTKSVECMPLLLSVFLTLSAVMWFFYGFFLKDRNIAIPNVLGFIFGILQIGLYMMYRDRKKEIVKEQKLPEVSLPKPVIILEDDNNVNSNENNKRKLPELTEEQIIDIVKLGNLVCSEKIMQKNNGVLVNDAATVVPKLQAVGA